MMVENRTPFPTHVIRSYHDDLPEVTFELVTKVTLDNVDTNLAISRVQLPFIDEGSASAPNGEIRSKLLAADPGISVLGKLCGGHRRFRRGVLRLRLANEVRLLRIFGPRRWTRIGKELVASAPEPVTSVTMDWSIAFGGRFRLAAGFLPGTRTPAPSTEVSFPANPGGRGFYREEREAEGQVLPQLESLEQPIERWADRPEPGCWAPLPRDSGLRLSNLRMDADGMSAVGEHVLHAEVSSDIPPPLRFPSLPTGAAVQLDLEADDVEHVLAAFSIPAPPFRVSVVAGARARHVLPLLERVQLRLDERQVSLVYRMVAVEPLIVGELRTLSVLPNTASAAELLSGAP